MRSFWRRSMPHWRRVAGRRWNGCRGCCRGEAQMTALSLPPASWREFDDICRVVLHRLGLSMEDHRWCRMSGEEQPFSWVRKLQGGCSLDPQRKPPGPAPVNQTQTESATNQFVSLPSRPWKRLALHPEPLGAAQSQECWKCRWPGQLSVRWWRWARCFTLPSAQEGCTAFW